MFFFILLFLYNLEFSLPQFSKPLFGPLEREFMTDVFPLAEKGEDHFLLSANHVAELDPV